MELTNPALLQPGATIGVVSPSAGLAPLFPQRIATAQKQFEQLGFRVKYAAHALENAGYVSASAEERAADLMAMFLDSDVSLIIASIGGDHSNQILRYLDFAAIAAHPKIFVGYSDITVLHYALATQAKLRTFYGPTVMPEFGEFPAVLPYTLAAFQKALMHSEPVGEVVASAMWTDELLNWATKEDLKRPRQLQPNNGYEWWRTGTAHGALVGGAIPSVNHLAGTRYWIDPAKKIFFLDLPEGDTPGKPLRQSALDSYLADLDNLGVFADISGLIVGRPYGYDSAMTQKLKEMILGYTKDFAYPILFNVDIGHTAPMITLPFGAMATLDSAANRFAITETGVTNTPSA